MKILLTCPECFEVDGNPLNSMFMDYLKNTEYGKYICKSGHEFYATLNSERYQILFDNAIKLFQDRDIEAAVLISYMALESFMLFLITLNLSLKTTVYKDIEDFVNKSIKYSENRKGAFLLSYYQLFGEKLEKSKIEKFANLRNDIIHDAYLPTEKEAENHCKFIFKFIIDVSNKLSEKITEEDYNNYKGNYMSYLFEYINFEVRQISIFVPPVIPSFHSCKNCIFETQAEQFKNSKTHIYEDPFENLIVRALAE